MTSYEYFQNNQSYRYKIIGKLVKLGYIFHGSNKNFEVFDSNMINGGNRAREGYGAYFTNSAYKAEEYGNNFTILSTNGLNIVNSKDTFNQLNVNTPDEINKTISQLNNQLDNVRNNQDYNAINGEIEKYKHYLNDTLFKGINYNDYEILKKCNFSPFSNESSIYNALSFAYNKLSQTGMQSISKILCNMGIDGYIVDNVYVIINFNKLNDNIVKDKEKLINNTINKNEEKMISLKRKDINEMVESIISKILKENYGNCDMLEADNPDTSSDERKDNNSHYVIDKNNKILMGWDHGDKEPDQLKKYPSKYFWKDVKDLGVNPYDVKIHTKGWMEKHGLDPNNEKNWDRTHTKNKGSVDFNENVNEELHNVIHKEGDIWKIKGHKGKGDNEKDGDWKADYKSKESAEAALKGYFAQKESTDKKGKNKIDEITHSMTDKGDEQSTMLKKISELCDFGIKMTEQNSIVSAAGAFTEIKEIIHKLYLSNKDNAVYSY